MKKLFKTWVGIREEVGIGLLIFSPFLITLAILIVLMAVMPAEGEQTSTTRLDSGLVRIIDREAGEVCYYTEWAPYLMGPVRRTAPHCLPITETKLGLGE